MGYRFIIACNSSFLTVLHYWHCSTLCYPRVKLPVFTQPCKCFASWSCKSVVLLNQNPCTPPGPEVFQFNISETHFRMLSTMILISSCFSTSANSCFTLCNDIVSWLWVDGTLTPDITPKFCIFVWIWGYILFLVYSIQFLVKLRSICSKHSVLFELFSFYCIIFQLKTTIMYFHFQLTC